MATFSLQPGSLDLSLIRGDEFPFSATFNLDLTGYALESGVYDAANTTGPQTVIVTPTMSVNTTTVDDETSSTVSFLLDETKTSALNPNARLRWYFRWVSPTGVTRTVLAGTVKAANP